MSLFDKMLDKFQLNYEDEEYDEYDEYEEEEYEEGFAKTLFSKLFREVDDDEEDYEPQNNKVTEYKQESKKESKKETTSSKNASKSWSVIGSKKMTGSHEINVIIPKSFSDVRQITDFMLDNKVVIVNLECLDFETSQRTVDFLCGATYSINGSFMPVTGTICVCAPAGNELMEDIRKEMYDTDFEKLDKAN
ncbi:MAG: cell division protein SepF [Agathobacter sp.]|nr:cell division protein SepF [Agathobacter sp.]